MYKFSDLDIKPEVKVFTGDKIAAKKILNVEIRVLEFKIEPSKVKAGTDCLYLQIEKGGEKRVVFTGSTILMGQIRRVPQEKFPFITTIKGDNDYYEFT